MKKSDHIKGLTVMEKLNDLDPALVADAEVDPRLLPPLGAAEKYEHIKARREARRERREENPFFRFMGSGAGAVAVSLVVAFGLILGIMYAVNHGSLPDDTVAPGPGAVGEVLENGTVSVTLGEGRVPIGQLDAAYTITTDKRVYETAPPRITLTMRANEPGVTLSYFQSASIESLTDPDYTVEAFWNDLAMEMLPVPDDVYASWDKVLHIQGTLPDGIYRVHHMEYIAEQSGYVSGAFCDFAVGVAYGELLESGVLETLPPEDLDVVTVSNEPEQPGVVTLPVQPQESSPDHHPDRPVETFPTEPIVPTAEFSILSASVKRPDGQESASLIITYRASEPGVTLYAPSPEFSVEKLSGDENPAKLSILIPASCYEYVAPDEDTGYAEFSMSYPITNPDDMLPGIYRIYLLSRDGDITDYIDLYWDGVTSDTVRGDESPDSAGFGISIPSALPLGTGALTITYRGSEPGVAIPDIGVPSLEKISGEPDAETISFMVPDMLFSIDPPPSEIAEGEMTYYFGPVSAMRPGTYRVNITLGGEIVAWAEFTLYEEVETIY